MELIISFETQYQKFIETHNSRGFCMGFCLTWLGDVLKDRPVTIQKNFLQTWLPAWFISTPPQMHARIPVEKQEFQNFLERVRRRHVNNEMRAIGYRKSHCDSKTSFDEITVNFKNNRQRELEIKTGVPGLIYSCHELNSLLAAKGVKYSGKPHGTILTVDIAGHNGDLHAVATISLAPEEIYYLDPNIGLFKVNKQFSLMDINSKIQNTYRGAQVLAQIIITRK
ncbi:hypothetical protein GE278_07915 [Enterobacteriaceae bacterium Kacie_13]|nr:hypothetical protein GE278_07915 [Enterobacteriaceae bacterium Kacie_13]